MAYVFVENHLGLLPLTATDSGITPPNQSAKIPTPPTYLGMRQKAYDSTAPGTEGEFVLLQGVASTVAGSVVTWDMGSNQTALLPSTTTTITNPSIPVAVSMAATTAALFGWYQLFGRAVVMKGATVASGANFFVSSLSGQVVSATVTGKFIERMKSLASTTGSVNSTNTTLDTVQVFIEYPSLQSIPAPATG